MAQDLTEPPKTRPKTRPGFIVAGLLVALFVGYHYRGLARSLVRGDKKPVRIVALEGESAVLPRAPAAHAAAPPPTRTSEQSLAVGGRQRRFVLVEPTSLEEGRRYPVVLVFHGDGGEAGGFHAAFPFERASGKDAIVAYPDGIGFTWDLETLIDNRDVKFAEELVGELSRRFPVDRERVFAVGYSSGGFLSNVIACQKSGLLRAISSSAGGAPYKQAIVWPNGYPRCPGQTPTATLALHGERDFAVTLDSGRFSAEYWAYVNGCKTDEMEPTGYDECRAYRGCPQGKAVAFCSVPGLGHWVWDEAAVASWTFFNRQ